MTVLKDSKADELSLNLQGGILKLQHMTVAERDGINSPKAGWIIWNTSNSTINVYNGTAWVTVT